jgi:hypothetical protein
LLLLATLAGCTSSPAREAPRINFAAPLPGTLPNVQRGVVVTLTNDMGGNVGKYFSYVNHALDNGVMIRFNGACASSCTLFLTLPPEQICLMPGAYFQFHQAFRRDENGNKTPNDLATRYVLAQYPKWVRDWLHHYHGGMPAHLVTMPYSYAVRYIQPC